VRDLPLFDGLPVLIRHVPVSSADHPRELDGTYLKGRVTVWDQHAIDAIESGASRQLSCAYAYQPDMRPGIFAGKRYDGVMRDIVGNHVALVDVGRVRDCSL
jgi:uncharacterized protein